MKLPAELTLHLKTIPMITFMVVAIFRPKSLLYSDHKFFYN